VISAAGDNRVPGPEASILKIRGTEIRQAISELTLEALGLQGLVFDGHGTAPASSGELPPAEHAAGVTAAYLNLRKLSIFGGSNEIQRNIISQMILGL
jgi:alkylation response protein AidB-like acyl-CoA dehydrogenase